MMTIAVLVLGDTLQSHRNRTRSGRLAAALAEPYNSRTHRKKAGIDRHFFVLLKATVRTGDPGPLANFAVTHVQVHANSLKKP
jgi:hypothetical protein